MTIDLVSTLCRYGASCGALGFSKETCGHTTNQVFLALASSQGGISRGTYFLLDHQVWYHKVQKHMVHLGFAFRPNTCMTDEILLEPHLWQSLSPSMLLVMLQIIYLACSVWQNSICCHQVIWIYRAGITEGKWSIFESRNERAPCARLHLRSEDLVEIEGLPLIS
jgi:hypothetical protein